MMRLITVIAFLCLVGCQARLSFQNNPLSFEQIKNVRLPQNGHPDLASLGDYIFDVQIVDNKGNALFIPADKYTSSMNLTKTRVIKLAGSVGRYNNDSTLQTNVPLWYDSILEKEKARLYMDIYWPLAINKPKSENFRISTKIACNEWAQALSAQNNNQLSRLKTPLNINFQNQVVNSQFFIPPYQVNGRWIFSILISLDSARFEDICLGSR